MSGHARWAALAAACPRKSHDFRYRSSADSEFETSVGSRWPGYSQEVSRLPLPKPLGLRVRDIPRLALAAAYPGESHDFRYRTSADSESETRVGTLWPGRTPGSLTTSATVARRTPSSRLPSVRAGRGIPRKSHDFRYRSSADARLTASAREARRTPSPRRSSERASRPVESDESPTWKPNASEPFATRH
jgi:hypothetical protein